MIGLILGIVAVMAFVAWLARRGESASRPPHRPRDSDIDYDELEAAEREVRDLGASVRPDDDVVGKDWGPGAARPRPPHML